MESFFDLNLSILAILLKFNSCSVIFPKRLNDINIIENNNKKLTKEDFEINKVFGNEAKYFF